jgi:transcriptional regulator GlxA family with amidase domain
VSQAASNSPFADSGTPRPMAFLREVRLGRARRDLEAADPTSGITVTEIATRCGFGSPSRFASHYWTRFGERPSRTLLH